jgi:hypothetical protein
LSIKVDSDSTARTSKTARPGSMETSEMATTTRSPTATEPIGATLGRLAHVVIGDLLEAGLRDPSSRSLMQAVNKQDLESVHSVHPYAVGQQLVAIAAIYLRLFALDSSWQLVGRERTAGKQRFDLVFQNQAGDVLIDEIKTGRFEQRMEVKTLRTQIARQLEAGNREWGEAFQGIRAVILGAPRRSEFHKPDGTSTPIGWSVTL